MIDAGSMVDAFFGPERVNHQSGIAETVFVASSLVTVSGCHCTRKEGDTRVARRKAQWPLNLSLSFAALGACMH